MIFSGLSGIANLVSQYFSDAQGWHVPRDPLVLDLDGDGIEAVAINPNAPILFDHNADGIRQATGWIKADDGIVVLDRDGNGLIDSGRELFGDNTLLPSGQKAANGFAALAAFDTNHDGRIDASDAVYSQLRIWQDVNQNAVSEAGELKTLAELNIASIGVAGTASNVNLGNGNSMPLAGSFTRIDGSSGTSGTPDVSGSLLLASNNFYREFTDDPAVTEDASALPQMGGSGLVRDLREAMSLGTPEAAALEQAVAAFAAAPTRDAQLALLDDLLTQWAASSGGLLTSVGTYGLGLDADGAFLTTTNSGPGDTARLHFNLPAGLQEDITVGPGAVVTSLTAQGEQLMRRLNLLEVFNGTKFAQIARQPTSDGLPLSSGSGGGGGVGPTTFNTSLSTQQIDLLNQSYEALRQSVYDALVVQTRLKPYMDAIELTIGDDGKLGFDTAPAYALLADKRQGDPLAAWADLVELHTLQGSTLSALGGLRLDLVQGWLDDALADPATTDAMRALQSQLHVQSDALDNMAGSESADILLGGAGAQTFNAGAGNDIVQGGDGNDTLYGENGDDQLFGGAGNDNLQGGAGDDVLDGGAGNDLMEGGYFSTGNPAGHFGWGNDTFLFGRGDGQDQIWDRDEPAGYVDTLVFKSGVRPEDVIVRRQPNTTYLVLSIQGTNDRVTVIDHFNPNGQWQLEQVRFADDPGTVWSAADLLARCQLDTDDDDALYGSDSADNITAAAGNDALFGLGGDDTLDGGIGNDVMNGGEGNDVLLGGEGNDALDGSNGNDQLFGGAGNDNLQGGAGDDVLDGGAGNDLMEGGYFSTGNPAGHFGWGNDTYLFGRGDGQDQIWDRDEPAGYVDTLVFKAGVRPEDVVVRRQPNTTYLVLSIQGTNDRVTVVDHFNPNGQWQLEQVRFADEPGTVWSAADLLARCQLGSADDDVLYGSEQADTIAGLAGNDALFGLGGDDTLDGGIGNDVMDGGEGNDVLLGGEGNDALDGSNGNDQLFGGAGSDNLQGGAGDDVLDGGAGNDLMEGGYFSTGNPAGHFGWGNDTYLFGRGDGQDQIWDRDEPAGYVDTLVFKSGVRPEDVIVRRQPNTTYLVLSIQGTNDRVTVIDHFNPNGQWQLEQVRFADDPGTVWSAADLLARCQLGSADDDALYGSEQADTIAGLAGNDALFGLGGDDTLDGGIGNDVMDGGEGNDQLLGGDGNDTLYGGNGDDRLLGGAGNDELQGGNGDDVLDGGAGNDVLRGGYLGGVPFNHYGYGNDTYLFGRGDGQDQIWDRDSTAGHVDTLRLKAGVAWDDLVFTRNGNYLVISIDGTADSITLINQLSTETDWRVERLQLDDGTVYTMDEALSLYESSIPPAGITLSGGGTLTGTAYSDTLTATAGSATLIGGDGNDLLSSAHYSGTIWDQVYNGGKGDDTLIGTYARDRYIYNLGDGHDTIEDDVRFYPNAYAPNQFLADPSEPTYHDAIVFGPGIARRDVSFAQAGVDMVVTIGSDGAGSIRVKNWFDGTIFAKIERFEFADGTLLTAQDAERNDPPGVELSGSGHLEGTAYDDTLTATWRNTTLIGGAGNDTLVAAASNDVYALTYNGGTGDDAMIGSVAGDTYLFNRGDGHDTILDDVHNGSPGNSSVDYFTRFPTVGAYQDKIALGAGIVAADVKVSRDGQDMLLTIANPSGGDADSIRVRNWYDGIYTRIEFVNFADGTRWTATQIEAMANAGKPAGIDASGNGALYGTQFDDTLTATYAYTSLNAGAGDDALIAEVSDDVYALTLNGGTGDDTLVGSYAGDSYTFNRGDGHDTIIDDVRRAPDGNATAQAFAANRGDAFWQDKIAFGAGIAAADVTASRDGQDMLLTIANPANPANPGDADSIRVKNWYDGIGTRIEWVNFADGTQWSAAQVEDLAGAGSVEGAPPAAGITQSGSGLLQGTPYDDVLTATWRNTTLIGGAGNDTLAATASNDVYALTFNGGTGDDAMIGSVAGDTYLFNRGDGHDTIEDDVHNGSPGGTSVDYFTRFPNQSAYQDRIVFGAGIATQDVTASRDGQDMLLTIANPSGGDADSIRVKNWYDGIYTRIEFVNFADGTSWTAAQIEAMANAGTPAGIVVSGDGTLYGTQFADTLVATAGSATLIGGDGNDALSSVHYSGTIWDQVYNGGKGDDTLVGTYARDRYIYNLGDGHDTIEDDLRFYPTQYAAQQYLADTSEPTYHDAIVFGEGITAADVSFAQDGTDMLITIAPEGAGGADGADAGSIRVKNWFDGTILAKIERFEFADGTLLTAQDADGIAPPISNQPPSGISLSGGGTLQGTQYADTLVATAGSATLIGGDGDDALSSVHYSGTIWDQVYNGGKGDDTLIGTYARDRYIYNLGDGHDTIEDDLRFYPTQYAAQQYLADTSEPTYHDAIVFGEGITANDVSFAQDGTDMLITIAPNGVDGADAGSIRVKNWYDGTILAKIERFEFADGTLLTAQDADGIAPPMSNQPPSGISLSGGGLLQGTQYADTLVATSGSATLIGGDGDDTLSSVHYSGTIWDQVYNGGKGDDTLVGTYARDRYIYNLGDGHDTIEDDLRFYPNAYAANQFLADTSEPTYHDAIVFGEGITASDVSFAQDGTDMLITIAPDGADGADAGSIRVKNWYDGTILARIERFEFADGTLRWADQAEALASGNGLELTGTGNLLGTPYDDVLTAGDAPTRLAGGAGNDLLQGGTSANDYAFFSGDGQDVVVQDASGTPDDDRVYFSPEVEYDRLWFSQSGSDLRINVIGTDDRVTVSGWYDDPALRVGAIDAGSRRLLQSDVQALVDAMATFSVPAAGETTLPTTYRDALGGIIAASWQNATS